MDASITSPPPFQWDHWYAAVGGRKIHIDEVNSLLRLIYDDQYKRFDGPVHPVKRTFESTSEISALVKAKALEFGADLVGICKIEPQDMYLGKSMDHTYAIAVGQKMLWRHFQVVPSQESAIECVRVYYTLGETIIQLAAFIRSLGYACKIEHPIGDSDLLHIPIGIKAGFGELGRHGSIIHPEFGPLFRMGSIACSMEIECDTPVDAGIGAFCDNCRACRIYCPAGAIPDERSPSAGKDPQGNDRYLIDTGKCFPYFANHYYCSACLPVCVYNHKEWARDFEGFQTKLYPDVVFQSAPDEVEIPSDLRHEFQVLPNNNPVEIPRKNAIDKR